MVYQLPGGYLMDIYGAKAIYLVIGTLSFVSLVIFLFIKVPEEIVEPEADEIQQNV